SGRCATRSIGIFATRGESGQNNCGDEKHRHIAHEMSHLSGFGERRVGHDSTVHDTRPYGEPDKAQVGEWIACGQDQENTQSRVDTNDHHRVIRMTNVPGPSGWPEEHERIEGKARDSDDEQCDTQVTETLDYGHSVLLLALVPTRNYARDAARGALKRVRSN